MKTSSSGKTIVIGGQSDLVTLDPGNMYEPYGNMISYAAYDMLYRVQSGTMGTPEPSVATDYTVDETGTVYTFHLRDDVVFASGNPLTAHDVVWSVNRVLNMKESNAYTNVRIVEKVEAPDDYTVVFTLTEPDASFLVKLTSNAYCILDSEVVKEHGGSDSGGDDRQGLAGHHLRRLRPLRHRQLDPQGAAGPPEEPQLLGRVQQHRHHHLPGDDQRGRPDHRPEERGSGHHPGPQQRDRQAAGGRGGRHRHHRPHRHDDLPGHEPGRVPLPRDVQPPGAAGRARTPWTTRAT